ncbi:hypothetical protein [Streptomyces coeruleorubidus]|uniref:Uncharacterized protein n=1 Tax=Streptomyces coeruleorubidus TaxID=116188 RepID=A0A5J6HZN2_STRC4|nr:hypothetical protein [Streptomyces coeruleorubidus]QEV25706.1 hypothetical protein CP976_17115 [Streptomyces coeruleorubidus]GGT48552.1 hypothetical protein GCM10010256_00920 [Streptomyces coeruleorubidus]
MHPDIHLTLHHARAAELRAEVGVPRPTARNRHGLRTRLGWTLVEVGLRLATRPGTAAAVH